MLFIRNNNDNCKNEKIIEIVSGCSSFSCLNQSDFSHNLIICLSLQLSFGDLKSLSNYDRSCLKKLYPNEKFIFKENFTFLTEIKELKEKVSKAEKIRVWSSRKDADEFLLLIYICHLFPDKNISVVFADEYDSYCWSIGCMNYKEVNELSKKEHILTKKEIEAYANKWLNIVKENSDIRYIKNGNVESVEMNYFDDIILNYLRQEIEISALIAKLMANNVIDNASDSVYSYLINHLIEQRKIEIVRIQDDKKIIKINEKK